MSKRKGSFFEVKRIPVHTVPILGFTGALGSGCSFFAKTVAAKRDYLRVSLSDVLHEKLRSEGKPETFANLQDLGNCLRKERGHSYLAFEAFKRADSGWTRDHKGVVMDGFRHPAEILLMARVPNLYVFSIQATEDLRKKRLLESGRCAEADFDRTAKRDSDEDDVNGQHVSRCNELADIVVQNNIEQARNAKKKLDEYFHDKIDRYLAHIDSQVAQEPNYDSKPNLDEAMMAAAYAVSKRSQCLKRNVGAVICDAYGDIVASGFNTVPEGLESCVARPGDSWCYRDACLNETGRAILFCPKCGEGIQALNQCRNCGATVKGFSRFCPE